MLMGPECPVLLMLQPDGGNSNRRNIDRPHQRSGTVNAQADSNGG